ncbi:hypothetical protein [Proteiniphilum sp.]|uniref:hypothetical protein n=1 Tax=Proteiniphilum sp. TaxID=1926877 RepID=UPI002B1F8DD9|nr:hypothetical protein [Proteiniphilum sp.]MEA4916907.1 hypothetical protein [Proteiniphilum sp.]
MKKIIAILTKKGRLMKDIETGSDVNIFKIENEKVVGYENLKIDSSEYGQFSSLVRDKSIKLIYMDSINEQLKRILNNHGIGIKCKSECSDDRFLDQFVFD